jgi:hypothetical protein
MSSEDEVNRFMVHGVAKTDYFLWENKQKVSRGELTGSIASLRTQNAGLHRYNLQLQQDNVRLQHKILQVEEDNTKLLGNNEGVKIEYKQLHDYTTKLYAEYRVSINDIKREKSNYRDITKTIDKYKTANDKMYKLLDFILKMSYGDRYQEISDTLDEVDKLVKPVYRDDTHETPNKL